MTTPADTTRLDPAPGDRPYLGILYGSLSTQARKGNQLHGLKIVAGIAGPGALAKETQIWFHRLIGSHRPQGWHHQLHNEPILNLVYEHRRKYSLFDTPEGLASEIIPLVGAMAGNVLVQAEVSAQWRLGWHLPDDFGTTLIRGIGNLPPPRLVRQPGTPRWGVYLFAGGGANAVARNLSLDGNTFRSSPHVSKRYLFPAAEVGLGLWTRRLQISASTVFWGREYRSQPHYSVFGAIAASVFF